MMMKRITNAAQMRVATKCIIMTKRVKTLGMETVVGYIENRKVGDST